MNDRTTPGGLRLLVDTDTASDDAVALLLAVADPGAAVEAVTTVAGNVGVAQATENALYTLQLAGAAGVPVHVGCDRPLLRPHGTAQHVHGCDGMSDSDFERARQRPQDEPAVDALLRRVAASPAGTLTLVALGPLTNVAAAVLRDRTFVSRLRHLYCMAGAADAVGNISPTAEYNVWADPEAAAVVLQHATPAKVTFVGWDVSRQDAVMTPVDQQALRDLGTPLARFADGINRAVNDWTATVTGLPGYDLPDPIAMAIALDPTLVVESEAASVAVGLGDEVRGQLIVDRRHVAPPPNVTLVRRADGQRFKQLLMAVCAAGAGATP